MWPFRGPPGSPAAHLAPLPPASARYAAIDSELTGLDPRRDSIVSLGGLRITDGRIVLADRFYEEVRPASALTAASIVLHQTEFIQETVSSVRVKGTKYIPAERYTIKLEGAMPIGFRTVSIAGTRDPIMISQIDTILAGVRERVSDNQAEAFEIQP